MDKVDNNRLKYVFMPETIWPCWSYALRRIGVDVHLSPGWLEVAVPKLFTKPERFLNIGDLLVWKNCEPCVARVPCSIDNEHGILWEKISYDWHVGVYEGNDTYTDMVTGSEKTGWAVPFVIRKHKLAKSPDFIIELSAWNTGSFRG